MPSNLHEWLLADLLRKLDVALPEYDQVRIESADVNNLKSVEYHADLVARRHVAQGIAEGEAKGRLEIILEQLATRFGPLPDSMQTRVRGASATQMSAVGKQILTAQTLDETLSALD